MQYEWVNEKNKMRNVFTGLTLILLLISSMTLQAGPVAPLVVELSQPDGTTFSAVPRGDEYANWMETTDGHTVIEENGTWYYAGKDNKGRLISTGARVGTLSVIELQSMPRHLMPPRSPEADKPYKIRKIKRQKSSGARSSAPAEGLVSHTQYVLTILVDYSDISLSYNKNDFQPLIYGDNVVSVKDFYLKNSYNGFTINAPAETQGTPNDGIIRVARPVAHPNQGNDFDTSRTEARAIVSLADQHINFASYDSNGDGVVSADELSIMIILAGYEGGYGGPAAAQPNVHGHKAGFASLTADGKTLSPYTMFGEAHAVTADPAGKHIATIGIMVHELGHLMLGLPDLYDTDYSSDGIGDWGVMGGGEWNSTGAFVNNSPKRGDLPAAMSAWSKVVTGFTQPQDIETNRGGVRIAQAISNEDAKRIWIDKYKTQEYFLVENRQKNGYDAGLPGAGLLIWHINNHKTNNRDESQKWVDLEEADGVTSLDVITDPNDSGSQSDAFFTFCIYFPDPFPDICDGNDRFTDSTNPNSKNDAGGATGIGVGRVSPLGTVMTADFTPHTGGAAFFGDHVRYDEQYTGPRWGFGSTTAYVGINTLNDTANINFDGVDVYVTDPVGATIDIYYYTSMAGGQPSGLIHLESGFSAGPGWNRLLLASPQAFPVGSERGIVLSIVNDSSTVPIAYDPGSPPSGRGFMSSNGIGTFDARDNPNLVALLSGFDTTAPGEVIFENSFENSNPD